MALIRNPILTFFKGLYGPTPYPKPYSIYLRGLEVEEVLTPAFRKGGVLAEGTDGQGAHVQSSQINLDSLKPKNTDLVNLEALHHDTLNL